MELIFKINPYKNLVSQKPFILCTGIEFYGVEPIRWSLTYRSFSDSDFWIPVFYPASSIPGIQIPFWQCSKIITEKTVGLNCIWRKTQTSWKKTNLLKHKVKTPKYGDQKFEFCVLLNKSEIWELQWELWLVQTSLLTSFLFCIFLDFLHTRSYFLECEFIYCTRIIWIL